MGLHRGKFLPQSLGTFFFIITTKGRVCPWQLVRKDWGRWSISIKTQESPQTRLFNSKVLTVPRMRYWRRVKGAALGSRQGKLGKVLASQKRVRGGGMDEL
jgi:hypothetical protein